MITVEYINENKSAVFRHKSFFHKAERIGSVYRAPHTDNWTFFYSPNGQRFGSFASVNDFREWANKTSLLT